MGNGLEFIKQWEGFRPALYNDAVGHCTIGYGTLVHHGPCDGRAEEQPHLSGISQQRAEQLLMERVQAFQKTVNESITVPLNQNQNDALVSFVYNVGSANFLNSTLRRLLNQGDYAAVPVEMRKWTRGRQNGVLVELPGLVKRREAEASLFRAPATSTGQSAAFSFPTTHSYVYHNVSAALSGGPAFSVAENPGVIIAGITVADAAQIGLGAIAIAQAQVAAAQGSFSLTYDKAQRLLTTEARSQMPGSQSAKKSYSQHLLYLSIGAINAAKADVIIEWEGNAYGEIGTPIIRRNLPTSTEWSKSSANVTITKIDRIPLPQSDPRVWPIVYSYEGTYDPYGNGYFEFSGEFEINAFGGLKFNRHEVYSRSMADWAIGGNPQDKVQRGSDVAAAVPPIPKEQLDYLKTRLP